MGRWLLAALCAGALTTGCKTQVGDACKTDDQCGSGFDCHQDVCVRVCTSNSECDEGDVCERYRCKKSLATNATKQPATPTPNAPTAAPVPDVIGLELRAIRRELELVRQEQAQLRALVEERVGKPKK